MVSYGFVIFTCLTFLIKFYFTDDNILCPWLCYHINTPSGIEIICEGYYFCSKQSCTRYSICIIFQSELTSRIIGTVIGHKQCDCGNHLVLQQHDGSHYCGNSNWIHKVIQKKWISWYLLPLCSTHTLVAVHLLAGHPWSWIVLYLHQLVSPKHLRTVKRLVLCSIIVNLHCWSTFIAMPRNWLLCIILVVAGNSFSIYNY